MSSFKAGHQDGNLQTPLLFITFNSQCAVLKLKTGIHVQLPNFFSFSLSLSLSILDRVCLHFELYLPSSGSLALDLPLAHSPPVSFSRALTFLCILFVALSISLSFTTNFIFFSCLTWLPIPRRETFNKARSREINDTIIMNFLCR